MTQIGTLEKKISKLETRKHDLVEELAELDLARAELTDRLGAAILNGGACGKIEADLVQMTTRQSGLEAAIGKADHDLGGLGSELETLRLEDARTEIVGTIERVKGEMSEAADQVMQLSDDSARWDQELQGAADKAHAMHLMQEHGTADHLRKLWNYGVLQGVAADLNARRAFQTVRPIDELRS